MTEEGMNRLRKHDRNLLEAVVRNEHELPQAPSGINGRLMDRLESDRHGRSTYGKVWYWLAAACFIGVFIGLWSIISSDNEYAIWIITY